MGLGPQPGPEFPPQLLLVYEALTWFDILLTPETHGFPSCDSRSSQGHSLSHPMAPPVPRNAFAPSLTAATPHWTHCGTSYEEATFPCSSLGPSPAGLEKPEKAPLRLLHNWEFEGLWLPLGPPQCQCDCLVAQRHLPIRPSGRGHIHQG